MNKLILIDGSNLLHRALRVPEVYELQYNGIRTGGVHSFIRSLMMVCKGFQDFPVVFWDKGFSKRRIELYPNYKRREDKHRQSESGLVEPKDMEYLDEYRKQRAVIGKLLSGFGVPSLLVPDTEADDMINYFSRQYSERVSCIMSEDLDYLQLLDFTDVFLPMRKMYYTQKTSLEPGIVNYTKINSIRFRTLEDLEYINTRHYLVAKAMKGDASDNIKGVEGIGEVLSRKLALDYIKNPGYIDELKSKDKLKAAEKKLILGVDSFHLSLKLIDLSQEEFSEEKIKDIKNQVELSLGKDTDVVTLMGYFAEYGLQSIMADLSSYMNILERVRPSIRGFI